MNPEQQTDILQFPENAPADPPEPEPDDPEYRELDRKVRDRGRLIAVAEASLHGQWEQELLPLLNEMHDLLAQRAKSYERGKHAGQQTWQEWLDSFLLETGLAASEAKLPAARKKVQRLLRKHRNPVPRKQRTVSVHSPNTEPQRMTFGVPEASHQHGFSGDEPSLKPGDRAGLLNFMLEKCANAMANVLRGLAPEAKVGILECVITRLIQSVCANSRGDGTFEILIRYVPPETEDLRGKPLSRLLN